MKVSKRKQELMKYNKQILEIQEDVMQNKELSIDDRIEMVTIIRQFYEDMTNKLGANTEYVTTSTEVLSYE